MKKEGKKIYKKGWFWVILFLFPAIISSGTSTNEINNKSNTYSKATINTITTSENTTSNSDIPNNEDILVEPFNDEQEKLPQTGKSEAISEPTINETQETTPSITEASNDNQPQIIEEKQEEIQPAIEQPVEESNEDTTQINNSSPNPSTSAISSQQEVIEPQVQTSSYTVYITNTGKKYHTASCSYLKESKIEIDKDKAISQGYTACSRCNP